jgi:hypothetical protein
MVEFAIGAPAAGSMTDGMLSGPGADSIIDSDATGDDGAERLESRTRPPARRRLPSPAAMAALCRLGAVRADRFEIAAEYQASGDSQLRLVRCAIPLFGPLVLGGGLDAISSDACDNPALCRI